MTETHSILVVTGSLPPDICGIGDYTCLLMEGLTKRNAIVTSFYPSRWSLRTLLQFSTQVRRSRATIVNIQYPTMGYGKSIIPHLLSVVSGRAKTIVTIHELSRGRLAYKIPAYLFFVFADRLIFTTAHEMTTACRLAPWVQRKSVTIPIGSNIPMQDGGLRDIDIVYFGHICPAKGLEEFASIVSSLKNHKSLCIKLLGQIEPGAERYGTLICERLRGLGVEVLLDVSADEASSLLSRARTALLPFPDGMSLRRGSALASMGNGALLLTTCSVSDSAILDGKCLMGRDIEELSQLLTSALGRYSAYGAIRIAGCEFARSFSWEAIASSYLAVIAAL
jgi:glycosyltransferase involved in cell wall biosynthesis